MEIKTGLNIKREALQYQKFFFSLKSNRQSYIQYRKSSFAELRRTIEKNRKADLALGNQS